MPTPQPQHSTQEYQPQINKIKVSNQALLSMPSYQDKTDLMRDAAYDTLNTLKHYTQLESTTLPEDLANKCIVRREDPYKVFDLLTERKPYTISFDKTVAEEYANAAVGFQGIANALQEGMSDYNFTAIVVGIEPSDALSIKKDLPGALSKAGKLDRTAVRSISGTIHPEDIRFIHIRIPVRAWPEELINELTEQELDIYDEYQEARTNNRIPKAHYIHRTYILDN